MKSLREYIEIVNETTVNEEPNGRSIGFGAGALGGAAAGSRFGVPGTLLGGALGGVAGYKAGDALGDTISNAFSGSSAPTAPAKLDPATFPQGTAQPSGDPMGFKSAAATDPLKATFPATQGTTASLTPGGAAASTTPPGKASTPKPAFKDLGKQYGYNTPEEVRAIQQQLVSMRYPIAVDGKFGKETEKAYKQAYSQMYGQQPGQQDPNAQGSQNYQQGQAAKQNLSKDMAAAVGGPNPFASTPAANVPNANKQALLAKAAELTQAGDTARAKIYTDAASRMKESQELTDILKLANLHKN